MFALDTVVKNRANEESLASYVGLLATFAKASFRPPSRFPHDWARWP
jgi:hypothetical protein